MKSILLLHNFYQDTGGEDNVYFAEKTLLERHGHVVFDYTRSNHEIRSQRVIKTALDTFWSIQTSVKLRKVIKTTQPTISHLHNTFPLISPSAYSTLKQFNIPIVQTLHNYRLFCANALLLRDDNICEKCIGKRITWPALMHACYRNDYAATTVAVAAYSLHRILNTWVKHVDVFIALTQFAKEKFISAGLPEERIVVKPNFVFPDPGYAEKVGDYFLFVGRLSSEKGINTLFEAWSKLPRNVSLKVVGAGPLSSWLIEQCAHMPNIDYVGPKTKSQVMDLMKAAKALIIPSHCYENFPMVFVEACATGTPVIVADNGALSELVVHQQTGLKFMPKSADALIEQIEWLLENTLQIKQLKLAARTEFELKYTAKSNYQNLLAIYDRATRHCRDSC